MKIDRKISFGFFGDQPKAIKQTENLSPEERISLLEELRYDLGEIANYDYSQRLGRIISFAQQAPC